MTAVSNAGGVGATPLSRDHSPRAKVSAINAVCRGADSTLRRWQPHALCRMCLRHERGSSGEAPQIEVKDGRAECAGRVVTPGEAEQPLVVVVGGTVNTPGTKSEARDGGNRQRASVTTKKELSDE